MRASLLGKRASLVAPFRPPLKTRAIASEEQTEEGLKKDDLAETQAAVRAPVVVETVVVASDDDGEGARAEAAADKKKATSNKKQRVSYKTKEGCLVMEVVLGDNGLYKEGGGSKTERWVAITDRVKDVLGKDVEPESLRKHVELLLKNHRKLMAKEAKMSELEGLMKRFSSRKEAEDVEKAEKAEIRGKKLEEGRVSGEAIRDAAMKGEKREKKKTKEGETSQAEGQSA